MRIAVLDLGSNSFRLLVAAGGPGPTIFHLHSDRAMLNLGAEVGRHGRITDPAAEAAVRTVEGFRAEIEAAEVDRVVAVATSAFRVAANGAEVLQRLSRAAGVPVRLIDGEEEARLAFAGMRASIALGSATALGLDLGGGSLDLAVGTAGQVSWAGSTEIGVSRLAGELVRSDPLDRPERRALRRRVRAALDEVAGTI